MSSRPICISPTSGPTSFASDWVCAHRQCSRIPSSVVSLASYQNTTCVLTPSLWSDFGCRPRLGLLWPSRTWACSLDCSGHFNNRSTLPFGYTILLQCIFATEFVPNSHLLQIIVELAGKVLLSAIWPHALDLPLYFPFDKIFQVPKILEDCNILFDDVKPCMPVVVFDEGDEISTPMKTYFLCWSPYIWMDKIQPISAPISFIREWKSMLLPKLASFTNMGLLATEFWQSEYHLFRLEILKPLVVEVADPLVP